MSSPNEPRIPAPLGQGVVKLVLLTGGVLSNAVSSQAETWWAKEWGGENPAIARRIDPGPTAPGCQ